MPHSRPSTIFLEVTVRKKTKKPQLPRAPLPRQTGGHHKPAKGRGSYNRQLDKLAIHKEVR